MASVIRNSDYEITTGNFCIYGGGKQSTNGDSGQYEEIIISDGIEFPEAGAFVLFEIPNLEYRYSINVDGENIEGTVREVAEQLYLNYDIYVTYTQGFITFTNSIPNGAVRNIAVKGLSDGITPEDNPIYCQVNSYPDGLKTFSLRKFMDFAVIYRTPEELNTMGDTYRFLIYNYPTDNTPINGFGNIYQTPTNDTTAFFLQLSANFNAYMGDGATTYSGQTGEFRVFTNKWFDLTKESKFLFDPFIGYAPFLGMYS